MVLRAKEYKFFVDEYKKYLQKKKDEEKFFKGSQDRLKAINKELRKLDKKLLES